MPPSPGGNLRVALVSCKTVDGDVSVNLENHEKWIARACEEEARFIGFPECSLTGNGARNAGDLTMDSPPVRRLLRIAEEKGIWMAVDDQGRIVARSRLADRRETMVVVNLNLGKGDFTISLWIKPDQAGGRILHDNCHLFYDRGGSVLTFRKLPGPEHRIAALPRNGEWNHVAIIRQDGQVNFCLNGVVHDAGRNGFDFDRQTDFNLYHGLLLGGGFAGAMDDLRIYRRALPPGQIPRGWSE